MIKYLFLFLIISSSLIYSCKAEEKEKGQTKEKLEAQNEKEVISEIDSLSALIENNPTKALFIVRANAYNKLGRFDKSVPDAKRVYEYSKDDFDNIIFYADMLMDALLYEPKYIEQAKPLYEKAIEMFPNKPKGFLGMAKIYTLINNPEEAITFINKALKIDSKLSEAYYLKGFIYQTQGKIKLAVSSYQTSIEQDPEFTEGYITLGSIFSKFSDNKSQQLAEGYFRTALDLEPENKDAFYGLGMLYQNQDKLDSAMVQYKRIISIDTTYSIAYFNQGFIYMDRSDYMDSAIYYFEKAIISDSLYADAYNNLGLVYERIGKMEKAKEYYIQTLQVNPEHALAKKNLETLYK